MQNKGAIRFVTIALALVCVFQLSFTLVTKLVEKKARNYAMVNGEVDRKKESHYLDSISTETVYNFFWVRKYTYKDCKEREINLGLDLKGGMNVMLEVSVTDLVRALSNNSKDTAFLKAMDVAMNMPGNEHFIDKFGKAFKEVAPNARLASIFGTQELRGRVNFDSSNDDVLKVLKEEAENAISNSFNILSNRIDKFGVAQPSIQRMQNSGLIVIELPGVKEPERVRKLLQGTASLEFWETYEFSELYGSLIAANGKLAEMQAAAAPAAPAAENPVKAEQDLVLKADTAADDLIAKLQQGEGKDSLAVENADMARQFPLFSLLRPNVDMQNQPVPGPMVGIAHQKDTARINEILRMDAIKSLFPANVKFLWAVKSPKWDNTRSMYELIAIKVTSRDGKAPLDGGAITEARDAFGDQQGSAEVDMGMNAEGARVWARLTGDNIGKCIAIVLDNYVYSYPRVSTEIKGGHSQITGDFSINEAKDLANVLKSGKLPAPARIIKEELVGPTLGQEAIDAGLNSFAVSFLLILVFMVFYYSRSSGLVADFALIANLFFMMGILASFGATLTLPGIAGIVLTMGMAVDANVLIFERIRDELRSGKGMNLAIKEGFQNALSAIIDGNVTTLFAGIILFSFGSGPIKGFATTLIIGIATTLLSGIFVTRLVILWMEKHNIYLNFITKSTSSFLQNTKIDFIGMRKYAYAFSIGLLLLFSGSLAIRGLNPGIDFVGGRSYIVRYDRPVATTDVAQALKNVLGEAPEVKTIGGSNQVKITTKYKIDSSNPEVDHEVDSLIYVGSKAFVGDGVTFNDFNDNHKQSSIKVGPTIAHDIKRDAYIAISLALVVIFIYILIRFRHFGFGAGSVVSLAHDAFVVIGTFSLLYFRVPFSMEADQSFIAAIMTIIGYSINDTVVIFDRIREYIKLYPKRNSKETMNNALNDTLSRTFITSFTVMIVLIPMFFFGGEVIRGFIFALIVGVISGIYSTVFIAAPIAYDIEQYQHRKKLKKS